jgi:thioredoxin-like negative regulator of GroEL
VNIDEEPALASRFGIHGTPTLVICKFGKEVARQSGMQDFASLSRWIRSHI